MPDHAARSNSERAAPSARVGNRFSAPQIVWEARVPATSVPGGDFLDLAQGIEDKELARLSAARLTERARRLRIALTRVSDGDYGVCSECRTPIPAKRLAAVPDTTTCVACQERLERSVIAVPVDTEDV